LVRRTSVIGSSSWPTPLANDGKRAGSDRAGKPSLSLAVRLWPTPTVYGNHNRKGASANSGDGLATAVKRFPTPTVQDAHNNGGPAQQRRDTLPLNVVAGGSLNPRWVELLMGFPPGWTELD
jgi:DNA (cytosine-5)-methyltransferase 1